MKRLPTRVNLDKMGIDLHSTQCPVCDNDQETEEHLFTSCVIASQILKLIDKWWAVHISSFNNIQDVISYAHSFQESKVHRKCIDAVVQTTLWVLWRYRNGVTFNNSKLRSDTLCDGIMLLSFFWITNRNKKFKIEWLKWIYDPRKAIREIKL